MTEVQRIAIKLIKIIKNAYKDEFGEELTLEVISYKASISKTSLSRLTRSTAIFSGHSLKRNLLKILIAFIDLNIFLDQEMIVFLEKEMDIDMRSYIKELRSKIKKFTVFQYLKNIEGIEKKMIDTSQNLRIDKSLLTVNFNNNVVELTPMESFNPKNEFPYYGKINDYGSSSGMILNEMKGERRLSFIVLKKGKDPNGIDYGNFFLSKIQKFDPYMGISIENVIAVSTDVNIDEETNQAIIKYLGEPRIRSEIQSTTFKNLRSFVDAIINFKPHYKYFTVDLPKELVDSYVQYLNYFSDYVKNAKGKTILLNVSKKDDSLISVRLKRSENLSIDTLKSYLDEYTKIILDSNFNKDDIKIEHNLSESELNFFLLELKNRNRFLQSSLEIAQLKNYELKKQLDEVISVDKILALGSSFGGGNIQSRKKYLRTLIKKGNVERCIEELSSYLDSKPLLDERVLDELILMESRNYQNEKSFNHDIITIEEYKKTRAKIIEGLLRIIRQELNS